MLKRVKISPQRRAQNAILRQQALQLSLPYENLLVNKRAAAIKAAVKRITKENTLQQWEDLAYIEEPYLRKIIPNLYLSVGTPTARMAVNNFLNRKGDDMWEELLLKWISGHTGEKINLMTATLNAWLTTTTKEIIEEYSMLGVEKATQELLSRAKAKIDSIRNWEARRIVQTETMTSLNAANEETIRSLGMKYQKTWSIAGVNTRPSHEAMDGVTIDDVEDFIVGGYAMSRPMDGSKGAPAEEIINCSCIILCSPVEEDMPEFL